MQTGAQEGNACGDVHEAIGDENGASHEQLSQNTEAHKYNGLLRLKPATAAQLHHLGIPPFRDPSHTVLVEGGQRRVVQAPVHQVILRSVAVPILKFGEQHYQS